MKYFKELEPYDDMVRANVYRRDPNGDVLVGVLYAPDMSVAQDLLGFLPSRVPGGALLRKTTRASSSRSGVRAK